MDVETTGSRGRDGPLHRPQEVSDVVLLLASDRPANITGTDVVLDGGLIDTL
jgi:NAD(P)-dependent dehydrogenase (short-subunit alcohol dehydrogenase family)